MKKGEHKIEIKGWKMKLKMRITPEQKQRIISFLMNELRNKEIANTK